MSTAHQVFVSPTELAIGDRVTQYGATFEVAHINKYMSGDCEVAACTSRLVGEDMGSIPRAYFDTPESMTSRGCKFSKDLPDGLYWNVQGNHLARVRKVSA